MLQASRVCEVGILEPELMVGNVVHLEDEKPQGVSRVILIIKGLLLFEVADDRPDLRLVRVVDGERNQLAKVLR